MGNCGGGDRVPCTRTGTVRANCLVYHMIANRRNRNGAILVRYRPRRGGRDRCRRRDSSTFFNLYKDRLFFICVNQFDLLKIMVNVFRYEARGGVGDRENGR